jgi:hypothetical protein
MPLMNGSSRDVISENIRSLVHEGKPQEQAIAAAYGKARKKKKKKKPMPTTPPPMDDQDEIHAGED